MKKVRPPIVTVLGHVDHGKTTLLDALRKTSVARKEAGGITQSTGASVVTTKEGKKITFIDTPGHAAFAEMRSRGAQLADIALLVVAADDGVKPQTIEALKYIKEAKIPFIVVISKIDISSSIEQIKGQLEKEGVLFEGRGGDTPLVALSAKTKKGIGELIEMITLVSEVNEIKADEGGELEAIVVETGKDTRGPTASVVVREGTLSVRDEILMDGIECRVRGLFNYEGKSVKKVLPGEPALVLGLKELPPVGTKVTSLKGGETKKDEVIKKDAKQSSVEEGQIAVVLKARSAGALEALLVNLPKDVVVVNSGVGPVNESDVFFAKSATASIFAYEVKTPSAVKKLAETEAVKIESFDIIYKLFERLQELVQAGQVKILGKAKIVASFPFNDKKVAGCKVLSGKVKKEDQMLLMRGEEELGEVKALSLKKEKKDIEEAKEGEEFGVIFKPQLDFEKGDMLVSFRK